jgi:RNA-splicing ligase RtcB
MGRLEIKGKFCKDVKIFTDNIEESAMSTLYRIADSKAYDGAKIRIMPDVHQGIGDSVIGFSCKINLEEGYVNPQTVGCDLGCTVSLWIYDKPIATDKLAELEHKIRKDIPFGFDINKQTKIDVKYLVKSFNKAMNKLASKHPIFADYAISFTKEKDLEDWCKRLNMDYGVFLKSIGTVGGGNHFIEYDSNEDLGKYGICVHCGSRNLGQKVFKYWDKVAKSLCVTKDEMKALTERVKANNTDKKKLQEELKAAKSEYLSTRIPNFLSGEHLYRYLVDVCLAQEYARLNHELIHSQIANIYCKLSDGGRCAEEIYTTHNYVDMDDMVLRKGAVRAYGGELLIIPFNMRDGISICEGKSNEDWLCTAPHGCGRLLSRSKAKETLDVEEFKRQMADAHIYTTTADVSTLDEAPNAYKPYEEIVKLIEPTVEIKYFMKPKINIKAAE